MILEITIENGEVTAINGESVDEQSLATAYGASADEPEGLAGASVSSANILSLLGGFQGVIGMALVAAYLANKNQIQTGADRAMTPSENTIRKYVCAPLGIKDETKVQEILTASRTWGDKGGDVLVAIADAVASK
jgi:hypothetical protein